MITAIVTLETTAENMPKLTVLARATMHIFDKQEGFISKKLLQNEAGTKLVQIIEWESADAAMACMTSSDWQTQEALNFMEFIASGRATMNPENYVTV